LVRKELPILSRYLAKTSVSRRLRKNGLVLIPQIEPLLTLVPFPLLRTTKDRGALTVLYCTRKGDEELVRSLGERIYQTHLKAIKEAERIRGFLMHTSSTIERVVRGDELIGRALGYPKCCRELYTELERKNYFSLLKSFHLKERLRTVSLEAPLEERVSHQAVLHLEELGVSKLRALVHKPLTQELYSLPYALFYPCRLSCPSAASIGKEYEIRLDPRLRKAFRRRLIGELSYNVLACYKIEMRHGFAPSHSKFLRSLRKGELAILKEFLRVTYSRRMLKRFSRVLN
jgi:hypothetical protein